jgi:hypothetical protein
MSLVGCILLVGRLVLVLLLIAYVNIDGSTNLRKKRT